MMILHEETMRLMETLFSAEELTEVLENLAGAWLILPVSEVPYMGVISEELTHEGYIRRSGKCRLN